MRHLSIQALFIILQEVERQRPKLKSLLLSSFEESINHNLFLAVCLPLVVVVVVVVAIKPILQLFAVTQWLTIYTQVIKYSSDQILK